ncbi:MAG: DUF5343 domain-containing protein [Dehalococcoidales bacterium]
MVINEEMSNRPYAPPSNVISVLQRLRSRNLPDRINTDYLRDSSIPDGTTSRTLFALRFLGLIDEGGLINESLKSIQKATDEEYKAILSGLIKEAYKEVFSVVDPSQDAQDKILNVFRRYTPASQRMRMVIFFLGMCREAGIPTLDVPKARSMTERTTKSEPNKPGARSLPSKDKGKTDRQTMLTGVNPALEGLIRTLPEPGEVLSEERRKQWLTMAEATLSFLYPETPTNIPTDIKEDAQEE